MYAYPKKGLVINHAQLQDLETFAPALPIGEKREGRVGRDWRRQEKEIEDTPRPVLFRAEAPTNQWPLAHPTPQLQGANAVRISISPTSYRVTSHHSSRLWKKSTSCDLSDENEGVTFERIELKRTEGFQPSVRGVDKSHCPRG